MEYKRDLESELEKANYLFLLRIEIIDVLGPKLLLPMGWVKLGN